jgi:hypothetical protein
MAKLYQFPQQPARDRIQGNAANVIILDEIGIYECKVPSARERDDRHFRRNLVYAADALSAAVGEINGSLVFVEDDEPLDDTSAVRNGETLQSVLTGALHLAAIRGRAADDQLCRSIRTWLEENGDGND